MYNWELFHAVFAFSIGLIPLLSFVTWKVAGYLSFWRLLLYNCFAFTGFIILCLIPAFYLLNEALNSPSALGANRRNIELPSPFFWNLVFALASVINLSLLMMHAWWKRSKNLDLLQSEQKVLDNNV